MLKRLLLALAMMVGLAAPAFSQVIVLNNCGTVPASITTLTQGNSAPTFIDTSGKICVNATVSATTAATATAAAPSYSEGQVAPISQDLSGNLRTNATLTGAKSNASSAVATSSNNVGSVSFGYGFNGATWDQLQVDASKFLKVVDANTAAIGTTADAACATDNGTCTMEALQKRTNQNLTTLNTTASAPVTTNDPCTSAVAKTTKAFSQTAGAVLIAGVSAKKTYVCSMIIIAGAAEIFNILEGTGSVCGTGTAVLMGSSTAANGLSLAANGGATYGSGVAAVINSATAADDVCLTQSTSSRLSGSVTYVQN